MNKEQQLQAYIDEWADIVYDHFGMGESNEYSLRKAWLAGHAAAVEEYKKLNGWVKVTPDTLPPYYTPVLCVSEKGIRFIAWLATDGGEHYWTLSDSDDLAPDPVGWQPLPSPPNQ